MNNFMSKQNNSDERDNLMENLQLNKIDTNKRKI